MQPISTTVATVDRSGHVSRRSFLKQVGAGSLLTLGFTDHLALAADQLRSQGKAMIVLWMQGGPSQFETLDPKSHSMHPAIATSVPGIEIAGTFPKTAQMMQDLCIVRSMSNKEGNHTRATYQVHTGYLPIGGLKHPGFGSLVASEIAPAEFDLPSVVSVLGPSASSGFLPVTYTPFQIANPAALPENSQRSVAEDRYQRRLGLLRKIDRGYAGRGASDVVEDHQNIITQASRLVRSPKLAAFDITKEPEKVRAEYGDTAFGKGCLLARRLVEAGVTYVEVQLGNWDTHNANAERTSQLAGQCDPAMAALVGDLKQRGLLDSTLVVWMGEFGRTPKINPNAGRDHFPRAYSLALAGAGVQGGQVIGKTDESGAAVEDQPISVHDLLTTFCGRLGIDPTKENTGPLNRPLKIVDGGTSFL